MSWRMGGVLPGDWLESVRAEGAMEYVLELRPSAVVSV